LVADDPSVLIGGTCDSAAEFDTKGLFPQLIDVLLTLAEGQDLLSRKVRAARLESAGGSAVTSQGSLASGHRAVGVANPFDGVSVTAPQSSTLASHQLPRARPSRFDAHSKASLLAPEAPVAVEPIVTPPLRPAPPIDVSINDFAPIDPPNAASAESVWPNSPTLTESTAPANRNYNFFDELDLQLASLNDPVHDPRSEDRSAVSQSDDVV
jgi:hypothetical protein